MLRTDRFRGAASLALATCLALSGCGAEDERTPTSSVSDPSPAGEEGPASGTPETASTEQPPVAEVDPSDTGSLEAQAALSEVCAGLSVEEAAETLGLPATIVEEGVEQPEDGSQAAYGTAFCIYMAPGSENRLDAGVDYRGERWLNVFVNGSAAAASSPDTSFYDPVALPGGGTGVFSDQNILYFSSPSSAYELGLVVTVPASDDNATDQQIADQLYALASDAAIAALPS